MNSPSILRHTIETLHRCAITGRILTAADYQALARQLDRVLQEIAPEPDRVTEARAAAADYERVVGP